jgi:hypothetical protein
MFSREFSMYARSDLFSATGGMQNGRRVPADDDDDVENEAEDEGALKVKASFEAKKRKSTQMGGQRMAAVP